MNRAVVLLLLACACRRASATDRDPAATASRHSSTPPAPAVSSDAASPAPTPTPSASTTPAPASSTPFGTPTPIAHYTCPTVLAGGPFRFFLSAADTRVAFIDGNDWTALVNRSPTGAVPPDYAPTDLVDVRDGRHRAAGECDSSHVCLRREAADALHRLLDGMRADGIRGLVQSAFRGFGTQCWVFANWAHQAHGGFCEATEQSALPGHSQHQLGTTVDLFTTDWAERGAKTGQGVFRNGFGCTDGGKWLDENGWRFGFVVPYPIDPDDRKDGSRCQARGDRVVPIDPKTGYKHEPWHLRYVGGDAAARYHDAWLASGPGTPREITPEQWLRSRRGLVGDAELPVCDGCSCGACATMAADRDRSPCGDASLELDPSGRVLAPAEEPRLLEVRASRAADGSVVVEATVAAAAHTPTQTPVTSAEGPTYRVEDTFESLVPYPDAQPHDYAGLPGAWRLAIEPVPPGTTRFPWRAALARPELAETWNRANLVLPSRSGTATVHVRVFPREGVRGLRVTLIRDAEEHGTRQLAVP